MEQNNKRDGNKDIVMKPKGDRRQIVLYRNINVSQEFGPKSELKVWVMLRRACHTKTQQCDVTVCYSTSLLRLSLQGLTLCGGIHIKSQKTVPMSKHFVWLITQ